MKKDSKNWKKRQENRKFPGESPGKVTGSIGRNLGFPPIDNSRHRDRLAKQVPQSWPGELVEDAAIFDQSAFLKLHPELAKEADAVRSALALATENRGGEANKILSIIPRGSIFADWRLFIRGFVDWLEGATESAISCWKKLNPDRRPGRMATVLTLSLRSDLETIQAKLPCETAILKESGFGSLEFDPLQLYHAKLLRRVRFDRVGWKLAATALLPHDAEGLQTFSSDNALWFKKFAEEFASTEPELVEAVTWGALHRAFLKKAPGTFDQFHASLPGPVYDPKNILLKFLFQAMVFGPKGITQGLGLINDYINRDLRTNPLVNEPLRKALSSIIHLNIAQWEIQGMTILESLLLLRQDGPFTPGKPTRHLELAIQFEPRNREAHTLLFELMKSQRHPKALSKEGLADLDRKLTETMERWSQGLPDDPEPRIFLTEQFFRTGEIDKAKPHVDFLAVNRDENPKIRAYPWKYHLMRAVRFAKSKKTISEARIDLTYLEEKWPTWLPKSWNPYLWAAWEMRSGEKEASQQRRQRYCQESGLLFGGLADSCMMIAATQLLGGTSAELKPFRNAFDLALVFDASLPLKELTEIAGFFWDLHRIGISYPSLRNQEKNVGPPLFSRIRREIRTIFAHPQDEAIHRGFYWGSLHRFFSSARNFHELPGYFWDPKYGNLPFLAAAKAHGFLRENDPIGAARLAPLVPILKQAAQSSRDAYYQYWFLELANDLDACCKKRKVTHSYFDFYDEDD